MEHGAVGLGGETSSPSPRARSVHVQCRKVTLYDLKHGVIRATESFTYLSTLGV